MRRVFINQSGVLALVTVLYSTLLINMGTVTLLLFFRYWEPTYEDSLNLIARVPIVASYVYRRLVKCIYYSYA